MYGSEKQIRWAEELRERFETTCTDAVLERVADTARVPHAAARRAKRTALELESAETWIALSDFDAFEIVRSFSSAERDVITSILGNRPERHPESINLKNEKETLRSFLMSVNRGEPDWESHREQEQRLFEQFPVVRISKSLKARLQTKVHVTRCVLDSEEDKEGEGIVVGSDGEMVVVRFEKLGFRSPKQIHVRHFRPHGPIFLDNTVWMSPEKRHYVCQTLQLTIC
jgi:hypothetical protein